MSTRVLVVDDEPQIRRALAINLRVRGYEVDLAHDGEQALELAARHHPDIVVLDLALPGINGVDVIRGLRGWSQLPIVVLSVHETEADKIAALDAGADDYVTKPFSMNELLARLRAHVPHRRRRGRGRPRVALLHPRRHPRVVRADQCGHGRRDVYARRDGEVLRRGRRACAAARGPSGTRLATGRRAAGRDRRPIRAASSAASGELSWRQAAARLSPDPGL
jgi:DNA-binding response OmpR family regulator